MDPIILVGVAAVAVIVIFFLLKNKEAPAGMCGFVVCL